ncbi:MAG: hypothetical protein WAO20_11020 [Acidobacteriota bacterium]
MSSQRWFVAVILWIMVSGFALAGEQLEVQTFGPSGSPEETGRIYIQDGALLRLDPEVDAQGHPTDNSVIFRADTETFIVLDPQEKDYLVLTRQRLEQFSTQLKEQLHRMREQLDDLPPEQRKMMEKMLAAQAPQEPVEFSLDIREIGPDEGAVKYEVWVNGKKATEVWVKPPEEMGIGPGALELIRKMSAFYETTMKSLSTDFPQITFGDDPFAGIARMNGFPEKMRDVESGRVTRIGKAEILDLDPELFAPPPDYRERKIDLQ